ncbi:hypothetical protein ACLI1A_02990 [Flavobacterium sp. RHBU_3]|uniref:hypothetical protein n=1 Tax=Flavobacterium sp. RHBU_3 TaxID=3391184 RepID=UPI00398551A4
MAYSEIEQITRDLDIFFSDGIKLIHLASGGGILPVLLTATDNYNDQILESISSINPEFEIEINPNLSQLLNLTEDGLNNYLVSFIEMAGKGFYSYDKTNIEDKDNMSFHLVAKPTSNISSSFLREKYHIKEIINTNQSLPEKFEPFNLTENI